MTQRNQKIAELLKQKNDLNKYRVFINELKQEYVIQENLVENVKEESEKKGLAEVVEYIIKAKSIETNNIYVIEEIHKNLFSKVPHPEVGGKFRTIEARISGSDVETTPPAKIPYDIRILSHDFDNIIKLSDQVNKSKDKELIQAYIKAVIRLKCELIKTHPFQDGNGRSTRALANLLFKKIGIPPVYIEYAEKDKYINAMNSAASKWDFSEIEDIYLEKITKNLTKIK